MAKKSDGHEGFAGGMAKHPDGHWLLAGARWHYPAPGDPERCAVPGCTRVLGQAAREAEAVEEDAVETLSLGGT